MDLATWRETQQQAAQGASGGSAHHRPLPQMVQVLHLAAPPPKPPAPAPAAPAPPTRPAGLPPDHLRSDLRTSGNRSRGERIIPSTPRHLQSKAGDVIFSGWSGANQSTPRGNASAGNASARLAAGFESARRNAAGLGVGASPAMQSVIFGEPPPTRPTVGDRAHLSRAYKHTSSTADSIIFGHAIGGDVDRSAAVESGGGRAFGAPPPSRPTVGDRAHLSRAYRHTASSADAAIFGHALSGSVVPPPPTPDGGVPAAGQGQSASSGGKGRPHPSELRGTMRAAGAFPNGGFVTSAMVVGGTGGLSGTGALSLSGDGAACGQGGGQRQGGVDATPRVLATPRVAWPAETGEPTPGALDLPAAPGTYRPKSFLDDVLPRLPRPPQPDTTHLLSTGEPDYAAARADERRARFPPETPGAARTAAAFAGASGLPTGATGAACATPAATPYQTFDGGMRLNRDARELQESVHAGDGVTKHVFGGQAAAEPGAADATAAALTSHPSFSGAAGLPSDSETVQAHPQLPGINGVPRVLPGAPVGAVADAVSAPEKLPDRLGAKCPWELQTAQIAPDKPAPPADYASANANPSERGRFRGKKMVEGAVGSNVRESYPTEEGGILTQAGFPEPAPRRWDDALFENRLKHLLNSDMTRSGRQRQLAASAKKLVPASRARAKPAATPRFASRRT